MKYHFRFEILKIEIVSFSKIIFVQAKTNNKLKNNPGLYGLANWLYNIGNCNAEKRLKENNADVLFNQIIAIR